MKHLLIQLVGGQSLSQTQAEEAFELIMSGQAAPAQVGAMLAMMSQRGPSEDELVGAASVMRRKVVPVQVPEGFTAIDTCGTGGTHSPTFNISTTAGIIAAAAGHRHGLCVAKHGNRSVTSATGSSQVLEALGVKLTVTPEVLTRCLREAGFCFCFAPLHHPAMKHAGPIRAELGFRTIFNLVGPLTNPAGVSCQLMGVYAAELTPLIARVLQRLGTQRAMVLHGTLPVAIGGGALGELTPISHTHISEFSPGQPLHTHAMQADPKVDAQQWLQAVKVETPDASAQLVRAILQGQGGLARDTAELNAAAALVVGGIADSVEQALPMVREAVDRGDALRVLEQVAAITQKS
ncbi:MAG: anthranilate phosphoribosyltransferase [Phycisphaerales bacterium]|nr:anthranilate phosphoribosyltransferase [Phycisphaerales bacterium]